MTAPRTEVALPMLAAPTGPMSMKEPSRVR